MKDERIYYTPEKRTLRKSDGSFKERTIHVPSQMAREAGERALRLLDFRPGIHAECAVGGITGKNLMDNVLPHVNSNYFVTYDLQDAYPNTDPNQLHDVIMQPGMVFDESDFAWYGPANFANQVLTECMVVDSDGEYHGLPLGGPASPMLFNVSCIPLDEKLSEYCEQQNMTYTRYLDDLTFSSTSPIGRNRRRKLRELILERQGSIINDQKTRVHSLANGPVTITGISIYPDRRLQMHPVLAEHIRCFYDDVIEAYENGNAELREAKFSDEKKLEGQLFGYHGTISAMGQQDTFLMKKLKRKYRHALRAYNCYYADKMTALKAKEDPSIEEGDWDEYD